MSASPEYFTVNLDPMTWIWLQYSIWVAVFLGILLVVVIAYHGIDQFRTPQLSKQERDAHRKRRPAAIVVGDDGYAELEVAKYVGNEGWIETPEKGKPKSNYIGFFPRPGKTDSSIAVAKDKSQSQTEELSDFINSLNTRKIIFKGTNNPIWVAVKSKSIVANILAIAGIQITEEIEKALTPLLSKPFPIDVPAMKRMVVSSSWNVSQVIALTRIHELIGFLKKPEGEKLGKWVVIMGIALCAIGAILCGVAAFA